MAVSKPYPVGRPTWHYNVLLPVAGIAIPAALTRVAAVWNRLPSEPGWLCPLSLLLIYRTSRLD
jgi:hypothetical protein